MKVMKKFGAVFLALAMCLSLACVAFAATGEGYEITIENATVDKTYAAYKIFDATYNGNGGVSYTISSESPLFESIATLTDVFELEAADDSSTTYYVTVEESASDADVIAAIESLNIESLVDASVTETATETTLTLDVGEPGYYYITTTNGSAVTITTADPAATVIDKNQKPGEGGKIPGDPWEGGFTKDSEEGTSANIGETIDYVIRSYAPTYDGDKLITEYTFTDTMSAGLTLIDTEEDTDVEGVENVTSGVTVRIISSSGEEESWQDITQYCTITVQHQDNGSTILVVDYEIKTITEAGITYPADAVVEISYQDVVNEAADENDLTNTVAMAWYKIDPSNPESTPEPGDGKTTDENLYTYGFVLSKIDSENNALTGATFTLKDSTGTEITFDATENGYEVYESGSAASANATSYIEAGSVYVWGLNEGTYTLTEITAPDGYNLLTSPVTITIAATIDDNTGEQTGWSVSYTYNGKTSEVSGTFGDNEDGHGVASMPTVAIENNAGSELPSTGGMGTTIFYIIGGVLVAGAVVVLITRRRMSSAD